MSGGIPLAIASVALVLQGCDPDPPIPVPPQPPQYANSIESALTGKCLDLPGSNTDDGSLLWLWECSGSDNQRWAFDRKGHIAYDGGTVWTHCVDLPGNDWTNWNQIWLWDCTNDPVCNTTDTRLVGGDAPIVGIARPADTASDPKLSAWVKDAHNPIQVDKGVGHYNAPSNIWSPSPGRWDMLFCLGWDKTWKGPVTTALYTTTDPTLHSWTQRNASFFAPHYGGGGSFWPIPGAPTTARLSHMLSADFHGDGHGTFALGHYDAAAETFTGATERGGVVDFSSGVSYFELGYSPLPARDLLLPQQSWSSWQSQHSQQQRLVMVGWTSARTAMTIVREIGWDAELQQLLALPVAELA